MPETLDTLIDSTVHGEVLVSLRGAAAATAEAQNIPFGLQGARAADGQDRQRLQVPAIDELLESWRATAIDQVGLPAVRSMTPRADGAAVEPLSLESLDAVTWYRVRFEPGAVDPVDAAFRLAAREDIVAGATPNYYRATHAVPNDPAFVRQWGLDRIRASAAWDIERGRASVVVAVLDTGVDMAHEELNERFVAGASADLVNLPRPPLSPHPDWRWQGDVHDIDTDPNDEVGHGTHVAGIIAASTNNALQGAGVAGCNLMNVRVLGRLVHRDGTAIGFGTAFDITAGIEWAIARRASIINMSFGFPNGTRPEKDAIERAFASNILPVAAMGNEMPRNPVLAPAEYRHTLAVGAVEPTGRRWPNSQTGSHISLVARLLGREHLLSRDEVERLQGLRGRYGIASPAAICTDPTTGGTEPASCQYVESPEGGGQRLVPTAGLPPPVLPAPGADGEIRLTYRELTALIADAVRQVTGGR